MDKFLIIKCYVGYFVLYSLLLVHGKELSCNQTPYPHVCKHYIDTNHPIDKIPTTLHASSSSYYSFHDMALKVTMDQAINYYKLFSTIELSNFKDTRAKLAWEDCLELYEDTINHLNNSMISNKIKDKLTWQSASIANHQTCQNGFIDFNLSSNLNYFPSMLTNFTKLLSNSLFISNTIALASSSPSSPSTKQVGGRKLLSSNDGFPNWVSSSDRRLLQGTRAAPIKADIVVAQDGSGNYKTISEGVAVASKLSGKRRIVVHVKAGIYEENVDIKNTVKKLMIIGDGIDVTIVTGNRNAQDGFTTFRSATFAVSCEGFIAKDITFENTAGPQKHQAVALRSGADYSIFYRCSFRGYQDTLYVHTQRQFYRDCDIYGTVDFIFGDAVTVLQNCNIYVRKPMSNQQNMVTAQGRTDPNENTGIIIQNSLITASAELKQVQSNFETFLGRPWQNYSRTVVLKSNIDGLVNPLGWVPWSGSFGLSTLYYGEYMNSGAGANTKGRVKWVGFHVINDPNEAVKFSVGDFLNGDSWIPATGIPFDVGL